MEINSFRVCLIDDDQAFMYLAKIIIKSVDSSIEVISFTDGAKGYDFFQKNTINTTILPDLVLLDLNMPYMDGWQFLDEFANIQDQMSKMIPIYILSSSISEKDITRAKSNPLVKDFISKPLEEKKFANILHQLSR